MAIAKNGILGGFSGSVGDIVGSNWKGITTVRSKSAIEKKPLTAKQIDALAWSHFVLQFWKAFRTNLDVLDLSCNKIGMSPMNVFQRDYRSTIKFYCGMRGIFYFLNKESIYPYLPSLGFPFTANHTWTESVPFETYVKNRFGQDLLDFTITQMRVTGEKWEIVNNWEFFNYPMTNDYLNFTINYTAKMGDIFYYTYKFKNRQNTVILSQTQRIAIVQH